jgi:hypothetical protein
MDQKARYTRSKKKDNFMTIAGMRRDRYFRALPGIAPNAGAIELPARPLVRSVKNIDWLIKGRVRTKVTRLTVSETKDAKPPKSRVQQLCFDSIARARQSGYRFRTEVINF